MYNQGLSLVRVTDAATEPLSVADAKAHCRIDGSDDDSYLGGLITAARHHVEAQTRRTLASVTWRMALDAFPPFDEIAALRVDQSIVIPMAPLLGVDHVKYYSVANVLTTLSSSAYYVTATGEPGRIIPVWGTVWPSTYYRPEVVEVQFRSGYATAPAGLVHAMKFLVAYWYEHRVAAEEASLTPIPLAVSSLIASYKWKL